MQGQYLQYTNAAPTVRLFAYDSTTGLAKTGLLFSGVTINYARDNGANVALTLVTATLGTWVANGFVERGAGVYDLYLPVAANASGAKALLITATAAATVFDPFVLQLGTDDLSTAGLTAGEIATAVAAPSAATIATAVAAPSSATITTAVWSAGTRELTSVTPAQREAIADTILGRAIQGAANGGRTVTSALRALRNRVARSGATLTVYQEDDTTAAFTAALTTDTAAAPITGVDPV